MLTEQASQAEKLLIEKDNRVKELTRVNGLQLQECTQRRAEQAVLIEEKKTLEANLRVLSSINKRLESENLRLTQIQSQSKKDDRSRQTNEMKRSNVQTKNYNQEIQQLTSENSQLKQQLKSQLKQLQDQNEAQLQERKQLQMSLQEIESLRGRIID